MWRWKMSRRQLAVVLIGWGRSLGESLSRDSGNEKCDRSTSTGHNLLQDSSTFTLLHIESVGLSQTWTNVIAIIEENGLLCTRREVFEIAHHAVNFLLLLLVLPDLLIKQSAGLSPKQSNLPLKPVEMVSNHQRFQERDFLLVTVPGTKTRCFRGGTLLHSGRDCQTELLQLWIKYISW